MTPLFIPSFRQLIVFEAVARAESVSGASADIHLSQPALTQAIARLEEEVGATLFQRRHTGCYLTELGTILQRRSARLFDQVDAALTDFGVSPPRSDISGLRSVEAKMSRPQLRSLLAIAETGSFATAARALDISEASLHRAARDLERNLRRPLFHRTAHGLGTTKAGAELARRIRLAIREMELAIEELEAAQGMSRSRISIGLLPLAGAFFVARALSDLIRDYPEMRAQAIDGAYDMLLDNLRRGVIDFIVGPLRHPDSTLGVVENTLFYDPYSVVVRHGHPLTRLKTIRREDLAAYDWVLPVGAAPRRHAYERLFDGAAKMPRTSLRTSSPNLTRAMLAETDWVTLLSRYEIVSEEQMGYLTVLPYEVPDTGRYLQVTTRVGWLPTTVQLRFIDLLREHARRGEPSQLKARA